MTGHRNALDRIEGRIVISCQAAPGTPLARPSTIAALAQAAELGGAAGLRIEGIDDVAAVSAVTDLPIIGLVKQRYDGSDVYITPTSTETSALLAAGVEVIALDATARPRPRESLRELVEELKGSGVSLMADVSTYIEGIQAMEMGFDAIGTTLHGYAGERTVADAPAFDLIRRLADEGAWVIAEGRVRTPEDVERCYNHGARSVVVGGAVTDPISSTRRLVTKALQVAGTE